MKIGILGPGDVGKTLAAAHGGPLMNATAGHASEMMIMVWLKFWAALGTADFNFKVVR